MTSKVVLVNLMLQPASQSCPNDISDLVWSAGTTYICRALGGNEAGRFGRRMSAMVFEVMIDPLGFWILIGLGAGRAL